MVLTFKRLSNVLGKLVTWFYLVTRNSAALGYFAIL